MFLIHVYKNKVPPQVFSSEFYEIFQKISFRKHLQAAASVAAFIKSKLAVAKSLTITIMLEFHLPRVSIYFFSPLSLTLKSFCSICKKKNPQSFLEKKNKLKREKLKCNTKSSRTSHRRCSIKKGVLKIFTKFTGGHLCQGLFFNKATGLR